MRGGGKFYGKCSVHFYARIPVGEHRTSDHRWTSLFQCGGAAPIETGNRSLKMNYELAVIRNALQHLQYLLHIHILQIGYCGCGSTSSPVLFNSQQNIHEESPGDILIRRCICNIDNIWNGQSCMECRKPIFNSTPRVCLKNRWENFTNAFCSTPKRKKKKKKDYNGYNKIRQSAIHQRRGLSFSFSFPPDMMPASTREHWHQPFHIVIRRHLFLPV